MKIQEHSVLVSYGCKSKPYSFSNTIQKAKESNKPIELVLIGSAEEMEKIKKVLDTMMN